MIEALGSFSLQAARAIWEFSELGMSTARALGRQVLSRRFRWNETIHQCYDIAVLSLPVMVFSLTFVSLMFTIEFSFHMKLVLGQDSLVPAFSTVFMLREFGPVVTCFLLTSRVGAAIAAEVATMKVTDQIDALKILAVDPIEYLAVPRWIACVFACVSISLVSVGIAILGGALIASIKLGYSTGQYFNSMFTFTRFADFQECFIKAAVFGSLIPIAALYHGFRARYGAEGVGEATTRAVVSGFLLIFIADFLLTYLLYRV
ncbi:MAG: ABC transporter permease [Bdellovibrionales bacterium]|nr:ABC transporter permease [Bdellovibrionales bacterium]